MDRAEFTRKVFDKINFVISSTKRTTEKRIEARKSRVDSASLNKWLVEERDKALSIPAFGPFDQVNRIHMGTPIEAAETIAQWLDFYFDGKLDWGEMWGHIQVILGGVYRYPQGIDRTVFLSSVLYRKVIEAETIAETLQMVKEEQDPIAPEKEEQDIPVHLCPAFLNLFHDEAKARKALEAAMKSGIINEKSKAALGKRSVKSAIIQFWDAVSDRKFDLTHIRATKEDIADTCRLQCEAIAEQFGVTIGKTAIYDHAGQMKGKYFTKVARTLSGN